MNTNTTHQARRVQRAAEMALMGTDTLQGFRRVTERVAQYQAGLLTESEAIKLIRGL